MKIRFRRELFSGRPLRIQLAVIVCLLLALGLTVFGVGTIVTLRTFLIDQTDQQLQDAAVNQIDQLFNDLSPQTIPNQDTTAPTDYVVTILDSHGDQLGTWPQAALTDGWGPDFPQWSESKVDSVAGQPFTTDSIDHQSKWRVLPLTVTNSTRSVMIALPLSAVYDTINRVQIVLLITALIIVVVGSICGYLLVRHSLRPLRDVETTAAAIASGDLSQRVPAGPPGTEVGELASSLNTMLGQVEQSFAARAASEARMRRFLSDASHELRTPLAAIRGYGELYRMGALTDPDQTANAMRRIEDEAARMGGLVRDLLQLARLDEGRTLSRQHVDLVQLAEDSAADLRAIDPERNVQVIGLDGGEAASEGEIVVTADQDRLRQVLANLIGNAATHTPDGSPVEIAVGFADDGEAAVEVRDHGPGIPADQRDQVFERFYRLDSSRTRASGGSGLGLAIVAAIVSAHGGRVWLRSTEGGGATVHISLPAG